MAVKPVPDGYHAVTPYLVVKGAGKLIEFMTDVFGAEETFRMGGDTIMHAEVRIGDFLGGQSPANVALAFQPADYFALMVLAFVSVSALVPSPRTN